MILSVFKKLILVSIILLLSSTTASGGPYAERSEAIKDLDWVLLELIGFDNDKEKLQEFKDETRRDIISIFRPTGLNVKITEEEKEIGKNGFLRIRVHKIRLERTVFLLVFELVAPKNKTLNEEKNSDAILMRYTQISNIITTVRPKIRAKLNQIVRWYLD